MEPLVPMFVFNMTQVAFSCFVLPIAFIVFSCGKKKSGPKAAAATPATKPPSGQANAAFIKSTEAKKEEKKSDAGPAKDDALKKKEDQPKSKSKKSNKEKKSEKEVEEKNKQDKKSKSSKVEKSQGKSKSKKSKSKQEEKSRSKKDEKSKSKKDEKSKSKKEEKSKSKKEDYKPPSAKKAEEAKQPSEKKEKTDGEKEDAKKASGSKDEAEKDNAKKDDAGKDEAKKDYTEKDDDKAAEPVVDANKKDPEAQKTQETVLPATPKELTVEPKELRFNATDQGMEKLTLTNNLGTRLAIKIKCSDNNLYRLNPVFSLLDKNAKLDVEVSRLKGNPKPDKLAIVFAEAPEDAADAQAVFKSSAPDKLTTTNLLMFAN